MQPPDLKHGPEVRHFKRPKERPFTASQREGTTLLFGGLTRTHERFIQGVMERLGYRAEFLPVPDNAALAAGKEFGNRGQCNPTYFTVGNLVKYLKGLRDQGVSGIEEKYLFVTAGSCGPCRFGMYEAEYRKALSDAGFPDFRVLLFQQGDGLQQSGEEAGLKLNPKFFIGMIRALIAGDLLNDLGYKLRPYEVEAGATDRLLEEAREEVCRALREGCSLFRALRRVSRVLRNLKTDDTRVKPKVKVIGEFWAQTTEGDGNYRLFRWLEEEGAEVMTEPVGTWIDYVFHEQIQYARDRLGLPKNPMGKKATLGVLGQLIVARWLFRAAYAGYRGALRFRPSPLPSQRKMARLAGRYYNPRLSGGESYMEVGKHILTFQEKKAHLVLSVKPFGCMPSTQSDGVQARVVTDLPDSLFLPIETSGDGEVNFKSRIQMKLYEAKQRARFFSQ